MTKVKSYSAAHNSGSSHLRLASLAQRRRARSNLGLVVLHQNFKPKPCGITTKSERTSSLCEHLTLLMKVMDLAYRMKSNIASNDAFDVHVANFNGADIPAFDISVTIRLRFPREPFATNALWTFS